MACSYIIIFFTYIYKYRLKKKLAEVQGKLDWYNNYNYNIHINHTIGILCAMLDNNKLYNNASKLIIMHVRIMNTSTNIYLLLLYMYLNYIKVNSIHFHRHAVQKKPYLNLRVKQKENGQMVVKHHQV